MERYFLLNKIYPIEEKKNHNVRLRTFLVESFYYFIPTFPYDIPASTHQLLRIRLKDFRFNITLKYFFIVFLLILFYT